VLYRREWHEPLTGRAWDEAWTRATIASLVADAVAAYDPDTFWPLHPDDDWGETAVLDLYSGAAGTTWALTRLGHDVGAAQAIHERFATAAAPHGVELPPQWRSSLFGGEVGPALVARARDRLAELVLANLDNPANELMLGVAGTLVVARWIGTGVVESEQALRASRDDDGWWTQHIFGQTFRNLGPAHGLIGNLVALNAVEEAAPILRERALRDGAHVNWAPGPGDDNMRLQWCHGAPGIVIHAGHVLDEDLLRGAAQLVWDAGPLHRDQKGCGICHGTAGNGYALLRTFELTQDELWLDRARSVAVHALEQAQALPPRYGLFTGGIGVAVFAQDVLDGHARFPVLGTLSPFAV
jgi:hypothetical protein